MEALADSLIIPLKGLPRGASTFDFAIGAEFFQKFGNTRIKDADCSVRAQVVRGSTLASIRCIVGGFVVVDCDRCLDDLTLKVDVERELTVGFGAIDIDDAADEEDVIVVSESDREISIDQFIYDYVCLSLPLVMVHPEGKCNPDMLSRMGGVPGNESDDGGASPFDGLKEMLKK